MKRNIEQELYDLHIDSNIEKLRYIVSQGDFYKKTLFSKQYQFRNYLVDWINEQTPLLSDKKYDIRTKIYWILNNISSWDDERVKCHYCGKIFNYVNVGKSGYHRFCCRSCSSLSKETNEKRR